MNKVKCLFGYHNYTIPHKRWKYILICDQCLRFGYRKSDGIVVAGWYEFDDDGTKRYFRMIMNNGGIYEAWYDVTGSQTYGEFS